LEAESRWHSKDALEQPALIDLHRRWQEWGSTEAIPLRPQFDPVDFPKVLPWLVLAEFIAGGPALDATIRYIGSEIVHYFDSQHLTGMRLSDLDPVFVARWSQVGEQVIAARAPQFFAGTPYMVGREYLRLEMLALPLSRDGRSVDYIVLAIGRES
jgi:hypothetical protein